MGTNEASNPVIGVVLGLVVVSLMILVVGLMMRRRGHLRERGPAFGWAILTLMPLVVGGITFIADHRIEEAKGLTRKGFDTPSNTFAP